MIRRTLLTRSALPFTPMKKTTKNGVADVSFNTLRKSGKLTEELRCKVLDVARVGPVIGSKGMYSYFILTVAEESGNVRELFSFNKLLQSGYATLGINKDRVVSSEPWEVGTPEIIPDRNTIVTSRFRRMNGKILDTHVVNPLEGNNMSNLTPVTVNRKKPSNSGTVYAHWYTLLPSDSTAERTFYYRSLTPNLVMHKGDEVSMLHKAADEGEDTLDLQGFSILTKNRKRYYDKMKC
eukprot:TRINITY_DN8339_c0_g1_i1.p1 TRINITY_DN8339_c0_g1~~TRINITY_DN8339_c0_g1_i1.p1  ORF type:complete len:257 (+),score=35.49 TRINITY_DN8339_c0_g1_i1:63-773(+)